MSLVLLALSLVVACGRSQPGPEPSAPPLTATATTTATARPTQQVTFREEDLGELGREFALSQSDLVTGVTANVQSDQEVWWRLTAELYGVDTLVPPNVIMGSKIALEDDQVRFHVFTRQWIGFQLRLERLSPPLRTAIEGLQDAVTGALDAHLREKGWLPIHVAADDEAITVTVEPR